MSNAEVAFRLLRWCVDRTQAPGPDPTESLANDSVRSFLRSRNIDSIAILASEDIDARQAAYDAVWQCQLEALHQALQALVSAGVRTLTFKGGELLSRHFPGHSIGLVGDADVLVPREKIETVKSILYSLGFRHSFFDTAHGVMKDRDLRDVADIELRHYELAPFVKTVELTDPGVVQVAKTYNADPLRFVSGRALVVIEIDVHHNVALDADPSMLFDRAVPSSLGVGETLSPADHVWLNLSRYYNEVAIHDGRSLRPFAYTIPEVAAGNVDWGVVEQVAHDLALGPTLSYFLRFCDQLAPGCIPASTLQSVHESADNRVRDWGWQLAKLFDFHERFPSYAFELLEPESIARRLNISSGYASDLGGWPRGRESLPGR
ncbi:nucleotidyltransferase family protein [Streptomyces sp. MB09-01]|uniref:nucleotidyltransferase family protein n=1 Tax=Streptomyces sp. MB09-01 TaxID=3028666 RepID=UPI0029B8437B|nr:nucleotidyltransferase family protein [Streptomyces sp. MB09-01]MDX3537879.1 nucleotidyltransferase family protein [Streptomyces sp. MB09-01]